MGGCLSQPANIQAPASVEIVFDRKVEDDYDIGTKLGEGVQVRARILAPDNAMEPESDSDVHPSNLVRPVLTLPLSLPDPGCRLQRRVQEHRHEGGRQAHPHRLIRLVRQPRQRVRRD